MFKKLLIVSAFVLSAVAVMAAETDKPAAKKTAAKRPAETIQLSLNLSGDNEATIEVVEKSANVRPGAKVMPFRNKKPGRALGFTVIPAAKGATEVTLKLKVSGKGTYNFSGVGINAKKQNVWFSCSSFAIGDKTYVPQGKAKKIYFSKWRALTGPKGIAIEGEQELVVKATFERISAKVAAKLDAAAKKSATKSKKN